MRLKDWGTVVTLKGVAINRKCKYMGQRLLQENHKEVAVGMNGLEQIESAMKE